MRAKRHLACVVGLGVAFSSGAVGQSIIEYGHGVGRAAAAGAASGTGIVGVFTGVKQASDDDPSKKRTSSAAAQSRPERQETEAAESTRAANEPANAPLKMRTSGGTVVSGVSPSWMGSSYREPLREPVRVQTVEWSNPGDEKQVAEDQSAAAVTPGAPGTAAAPGSAEETLAASTGPARVVSPGQALGNSSGSTGLGSGNGASAFGVPPQLEPVTDAEIAGVRIGSPIDEVVQALGRPTFSLTGIAGKSYTEKYVFKNAEGETITVLTWAGVVTSVSVS